MYIEMHSVDANNDESSGKTSWVNRSEYKISLMKVNAEHLGSPPWYVQLLALQELGTSYDKTICRTAGVQLTPKDIEILLTFLSDKRLLNVERIGVNKQTKTMPVKPVAKKLPAKKPSAKETFRKTDLIPEQ